MNNNQSPPKIDGLHVLIAPGISGPRSYRLTIRNIGQTKYVDGSIDYYAVVGPGSFGLDDTHMPADMRTRPPIRFQSLSPEEELSFEIEGFDSLEKFKSPHGQPPWIHVAFEENKILRRKGLYAHLNVSWAAEPDTAPKIVSAPPIPAHRWLSELGPVIGLFFLGLLVLCLVAYRK